MPLTVKSVCVSMMETNCYIITDEKTRLSAVIDPGEYCNALVKMLSDNAVTSLEYILLTHGHFDHIQGVKKLKEHYGGKVVIHKEDEKCFTNSYYSLSDVFLKSTEPLGKADITVKDADKLLLGESEITVMHTPGHTQGGVCYISGDIMFTGDTLFAENIGNSNFPGGNMLTLLQSVASLAALEGDYKVYPGHGEATALEYERRNNPYIIRHKKK